LTDGVAIAADKKDHDHIIQTLFEGLNIPRAMCFEPAVCAMYANSRREYGVVINVGEQGT
jgi:actin-related protein